MSPSSEKTVGNGDSSEDTGKDRVRFVTGPGFSRGKPDPTPLPPPQSVQRTDWGGGWGGGGPRPPLKRGPVTQQDAGFPRILATLSAVACLWAAVLLAAVPAARAGASAPPQAASGFRAYASDINDQEDREIEGESNTVRIVGARNGAFSGKVAIRSAGPIRDLKAAVGDLKGTGGAIPASQIQVRYGHLWWVSWAPIHPLACLSEGPLETSPGGAKATASVWITVRVPKGASAGVYRGEVAVSAAGVPARRIPVELKVADAVLPDPKDYVTWVGFVQTPDTLSLEYSLPLWSDKHWEMVGRSFQRLGELGNKTLYVPLIAHTNMGNEESMVRWIKKGDGSYEHDYSIMEKYLDLAIQHMGKPRLVVLFAWELYMMPDKWAMSDEEAAKLAAGANNDGRSRAATIVQARQAANIKKGGGTLGRGPLVTAVDPATRQVQLVELARYDKGADKAAWKALYDGVRQRLRKRGLDQVMMLGVLSDSQPSRAEAEFLNQASGNLPWVIHSHYGCPSGVFQGVGKIGYETRVWGDIRFADGGRQTNQKDPVSTKALYGWKQPGLVAAFERTQVLDISFPLARWRFFTETCVTGSLRGVGWIGGDFWDCIKNKAGKRAGNARERFPESSRNNLNLYNSILAPAPEGPAATDKFEAFREGLQETEARILIERALTDESLRKRLGEELAQRAQGVLDERLACMWKSLSVDPTKPIQFAWRFIPGPAGHQWFLKSGWRDRTQKLFDLAGEVQRKLAAK